MRLLISCLCQVSPSLLNVLFITVCVAGEVCKASEVCFVSYHRNKSWGKIDIQGRGEEAQFQRILWKCWMYSCRLTDCAECTYVLNSPPHPPVQAVDISMPACERDS